MLREPKNDLFHLLTILESIGKINKYVSGITSAEELIQKSDQLVFNACLNLLANIGETLPKCSDSTLSNIEVEELRKIKDFRNRIVHDYVSIDSLIVFSVIQKFLPLLNSHLESILSDLISQNIVDSEEYQIARSSNFYKHVRFEKFLS